LKPSVVFNSFRFVDLLLSKSVENIDFLNVTKTTILKNKTILNLIKLSLQIKSIKLTVLYKFRYWFVC